jgi:hypothetical protein
VLSRACGKIRLQLGKKFGFLLGDVTAYAMQALFGWARVFSGSRVRAHCNLCAACLHGRCRLLRGCMPLAWLRHAPPKGSLKRAAACVA